MFEKAKTSPSYPASLDFVFIFMYVLTVESQTYDPLTLASQVLGLQKKKSPIHTAFHFVFFMLLSLTIVCLSLDVDLSS